jgi:hypothetical protein
MGELVLPFGVVRFKLSDESSKCSILIMCVWNASVLVTVIAVSTSLGAISTRRIPAPHSARWPAIGGSIVGSVIADHPLTSAAFCYLDSI